MKKEYDVVIIGSGYGASVAAARFSEIGKSVCILEKGKEYINTKFPENEKDVLENLQVNIIPGSLKNRSALFDYKIFNGLHILTGSGLGGGSLINAGILERPIKEVLYDDIWPEEFKKDIETKLEESFNRASKTLGSSLYPTGRKGFPHIEKREVLNRYSLKNEKKFKDLEMSINFNDSGYNEHGVFQSPCSGCGNCSTGCNYGAKNSLDKNYLAIAATNGAEIYTKKYVSHFSYLPTNKYNVYYLSLHEGNEKKDYNVLEIVSCDILVLGAGSIGSTEILLKTKEISGMKFSERLGYRFSGNGGVISAGLNLNTIVNQVGLEKNILPDRRSYIERRSSVRVHKKDRRKMPILKLGSQAFINYGKKVGPTITSMIDNRDIRNIAMGTVIEDAAIPGIFSDYYLIYWILGNINSKKILKPEITITLLNGIIKNFFSGIRNPILANSAVLLGMGHDESFGCFRLVDGRDLLNSEIDIYWSEYGHQNNIKNLLQQMSKIVESYEGDFVDYRGIASGNPISVHPLGGAIMGKSVIDGVVNHELKVYNPEKENSVYPGLYVMDGSVIPRSLGINPALTITAIVERAMLIYKESLNLNNENNKRINASRSNLYNFYNDNISKNKNSGVRFEESYFGFISKESEDFLTAYSTGKRKGASNAFNMEISIHIKDIDSFTKDEPIGRLTGLIDCPMIGNSEKMSIREGTIHQFIENKPSRNTFIIYKVEFINKMGEIYFLDGYKSFSSKIDTPIESELTNLHFRLYSKEKNQNNYLGSGITSINLSDFLTANLASLRTINNQDILTSNLSKIKYAHFFIRKIFDVYSPKFPLREIKDLIPSQLKIKKHSDEGIHNAIIESYPLETQDNLWLLLRKVYRKDSSNNSVLLIHGLTSSSDMFIMPEHYNLTNYLLDLGYTVWLFDFRMSGRFTYNSSRHSYSFDHIAAYDMPLATTFIRKKIGEKAKLNIICHCLGSLSFNMSLFSGLQVGVDSVISNSVSLFCRIPFLAKMKLEYLIQNDLLENVFRLNVIDPAALGKKDWLQSLVSYGNSILNHECDNATCHMLSFMWGCGSSVLFNHENILEITHDRLCDLFSETTFHYYKHVLKIVNLGMPTRFNNSDSQFNKLPSNYLEKLKANKTPILLISGADNKVFTDSNYYTYRKLSNINPTLYKFHTFLNYGHQDIFMGKNVHLDVFPVFKEFLSSI